MSNNVDGIDGQIERLQSYRKAARQKNPGPPPTSEQLAIEQALASAYAAKELESIKQLLTVLKEKT